MRTPNTECAICAKPLYRRPSEFNKCRYFSCLEHRSELQKIYGVTEAQILALELGREKGTNHRVGFKHSEETKRKMSESRKKWCSENKDMVIKAGEKIRKDNHYNWNGGSSFLNISIRRMTENRKWMDAIKARDKKCVMCNSTENLESHHINELSQIIKECGIKTRNDARICEKLWDLSNGITLCRKCHYKIHGRKYED